MYRQVRIHIPNKEEANTISKTLVEKKLVAGTILTNGLSHFWWDGKVHEENYYVLIGFTLAKLKDEIIACIRPLHSDNCPLIVFTEIDANKDLLEWIDQNTL